MINYAFEMTIADRIRQLRANHAMTQEDLASRSGLGVTTIQRVERGGRPSADTIASLAAAFGLQSSDLTNPRPNFDDQPYLPLTVVATGRQLLRLLLSSDSLDFCFAELTDLAQAELVDRLQSWCASHDVGGERLDRGDAASSKRIVAFTRDYEAIEASVGFERLDGVRIRTRSAQASFEGRLPYAAPAMREDAFPLL